MIKLCEVLSFNKITHIVVVKYDEIQIQFVTDKDTLGSTAYIKKNDTNYEIVDKTEYEKSLKTQKKSKKIMKEEISAKENVEKDIVD